MPTDPIPVTPHWIAVDWPAGDVFTFADDGVGVLVLGARIPSPEPELSLVLPECAIVQGVPENIRVDAARDGTVLRIGGFAPTDPGEPRLVTVGGITFGDGLDEVLTTYGQAAVYREVKHPHDDGDITIEYRVDVPRGDSVLVLTFAYTDAEEPEPAKADLGVIEFRIALSGHEDPPWLCA